MGNMLCWEKAKDRVVIGIRIEYVIQTARSVLQKTKYFPVGPIWTFYSANIETGELGLMFACNFYRGF